MKEITVDYALLALQRRELESRLWKHPSPLLEGLLEMIEIIEEQRPFREVKDDSD